MPLVDVHEFLAPSRSQGPAEVRRGEFRTHASADLDVKFLLALAAQGHPLSHIACIPDFVTCGTTHPLTVYHRRCRCEAGAFMRIRAGLVITNLRDRPRLWVPDHFEHDLEACRRKKKRFVVANLGIYSGSDLRKGHSNGLTFALRERVIERWEPEGRDAHDATIRHLLLARLPGWKYVGTTFSRPLQTPKTDAFGGMCVTFTLMYLLMRLANPNATPREIHAHLLSRSDASTRDRTLRLNRYVADTLRGHARGSLTRLKRSRSRKR